MRLLLLLAFVAVVSAATTLPDYMDPNLKDPQQVRVAFGAHTKDNSAVSMTVSWLTYNSIDMPIVKFGLSSGNYTTTTNGYTTFYFKSFHHNAVLEGLKHSTTYFYICGDKNSSSYSREFSFKTPPPKGQTTPFKVAIYGDMGITASEGTRDRLIKRADDLDFVYHIGDFAYADDRVQADYETTWNIWQTEMEPLTANKAYMTTPGNHEATCWTISELFCDKRLDNFTAYNHRFRMPSQESGGALNMFYSFDYGNVHFVSISTETDFPGAPEGPWTLWWTGPFGNQLEWLENDLKQANVDREKTKKWIIVGGHRPMYTGSHDDFPPNESATLRQVMEKLFKKYKVDLFFAGHVHAYERMYPVYDSQLEKTDYNNPENTVHVVVGCAGNIEGHEGAWPANPPSYIAHQNNKDYGYGVLNVLNGTTVHWALHRASDDTVADEFYLTKNH